MGFYGLPAILQRRPMDGAQFHPLWVGEAGGRLNGVRKKWGERTKRPKSIPRGLKPDLYFVAFAARLKPCPCKAKSFSAAFPIHFTDP